MPATLPSYIRHQPRKANTHFRENPNHPSLRFKKIHTTEPICSARINMNYRVVGVVDDGVIV
ncbi:MAG: hypothetical protein OXP71_08795 [Candidatus Poribacteria bacterium]|nr:hypothetical protein [Candidatus Poribacteria bacterium]